MVRYKNRYIAVKVDPIDVPAQILFKLNSTALYHSVLHKVRQLHGDFGVSAIKVGFSAKYCNEITRVAIIRVRHGPHKFVSSVLPFVKEIARKRVIIQTLYCGATICQCNRFLKIFQFISTNFRLWRS